MSFYMTYLARWPHYFHVVEAPGNQIMGYIMGKVEGQAESWHGHVTTITVASEHSGRQLTKKLMHMLENISDKIISSYNFAVMGEVEGQDESWHGHVTAITVASEYRRQQLAKKLKHMPEDIGDKMILWRHLSDKFGVNDNECAYGSLLHLVLFLHVNQHLDVKDDFQINSL
ncbi:hypothetical protein HHK36_012642 [Tetracentron sinense]|uniref:N-acetyltransferase domain-containing protein n=1 Tax=Tetracentron sinense TaxID=13715 RepID=A0A834Z9I7_TETSI|nr:hypothetical protein HHK36_012642 [Tetracentron sinense]